MKTLSRLLAIFACILSITIAAQTATLDSKKIIASIPEMAKIDTLVAKEQQRYSLEYNAKVEVAQKLQNSTQELYNKNAKDTAIAKNKAMLEKQVKELKDFQQMANQKIEEYKELLYKPYIEKINNAIKTVAESKKILQVIDIQVVPLAYLDPAADITAEVIKTIK